MAGSRKKVLLVGALGRMGERVRAALEEHATLRLAAALEAPGHPGIDSDAGSGSGSGEAPPTDSEGEPIYGEFSDPQGGYLYWEPGYGRPLPSRSYYHADAVQWRIVGGTGKVRDYAGGGQNFRVYLRPGESFDGVRVQWRDRSGAWHDH